MIPAAPQMLMQLAGVLGTRVVPALDPENYAAGDAKSVALLLVLLAQEADGAVDRLVREIAEMREILGEPAQVPPCFRVSVLQAEHDRLTGLLIELHAVAEATNEVLNRRIWSHLKAAAEARSLALPEAG